MRNQLKNPRRQIGAAAAPARRRIAIRFATIAAWIAVWTAATPSFSAAAELLYDSAGFERMPLGEPPAAWQPFPARTRPNLRVASGGDGEGSRCLQGQRSSSGGLCALSLPLPPQQRIEIEFRFAYSTHSGRTLNVWTHEPNGRDASQLNLCIQGKSLMQFDGRTRQWVKITDRITPSADIEKPVWHRLRILVDANRPGIDFRLSDPGKTRLPEKAITRQAYRTGLPIGALDLVSGQRITAGGWYLIDDLVIRGGDTLAPPGAPPELPKVDPLWSGPALPKRAADIPFVQPVEHRTVHRASAEGYKFLHGAAIVEYKGVLFANWANSPEHENGPHETLQGRRSHDQGRTWTPIEIIGPGFEGLERHSHGVLFEHQGRLWTICARFGSPPPAGRRFPGLVGEAFVLSRDQQTWESRGVVMQNCWPYDQPVRMANGNLITGGQDKDGLPVVAISDGDNIMRWKTILLPYPPQLAPSFAETTVWADNEKVLAVIRGGGGVAWVARSKDNGETWSSAAPSNFPMPRAKAYLGRLSTGQLYLISNFHNRDTLAISVSKPGGSTLERIWRIRDGRSQPPRFPGRAKSKQWSYPYAYEHDGKLYVVYSIGKEDCGLSVFPLSSLTLQED